MLIRASVDSRKGAMRKEGEVKGEMRTNTIGNTYGIKAHGALFGGVREPAMGVS